jgi:hypothetical protein
MSDTGDVDPAFETSFDEIFNAFDADEEAKLAFQARGDEFTVGGTVLGPGQAPTVGAGPRRARRKADTTSEDAYLRHNWIPIGPRNVGGRVRALAIAPPPNGNTMYAGTASGGVWKTLDGGQSWFPLWHDEPALPVAALSICTGTPRVIWAATGEHRHSSGDGIYRSDNNGDTWQNAATPHVPGAANAQGLTFEAIAAHPTNVNRAWAVGASGVFRTIDGGTNWTQFRAGEHWSDVAYSTDTAGGFVLYLVLAVSAAGEASVVVLPNADDTDVNIRAILRPPPAAIPAAHISQVIAPGGGGPNPKAGKIAVAATTPNLAYVRFADVNKRHLGVFRSVNAQLAPPATGSAIVWAQIADSPDFAGEGQGDYNLTMAVTPDGQNIATGMVDLHVLANAHTAPGPPPPAVDPWRKAIAWEIWATDRSHHADQHVSIFAPDPAAPANILLWAGNDGGISMSRNWQAGTGHAPSPVIPIPPGSIAWEKRSEGLSATQMYDLSQSPVVPGMIGCGFQDNGVFVTGGGPTWSLIMGADGGYVAFDPDDPYRFLATWQNGIVEVHVPGLLNRIVKPVGSTVAPWPRSLMSGFNAADLAEFVAETVYHPSRGRSVFHTRRNTLYRRSSTAGERWIPVPLGRGIELRNDTANPTSTLEVLASGAAGKLGLVPQRSARTPFRGRSVARCHSLLHGPYKLADGDQLRFQVDANPVQTATFRTANFADIANATPAEVAAVINRVAPGVAQSVCYTPAVNVHLVAKVAATPITIGGSSTGDFNVAAGTVTADVGHHAIVTLAAGIGTDMRGKDLTIQLGAGDVVTIDLDRIDNPHFYRPGALARVLKDRLDVDTIGVGLHDLEQHVRLTRVGAGNVTAAGTAVTGNALTLTPTPPATNTATQLAPFALLNAPAFTFQVGDTVNTATVTFNAAVGVANRAIVSAHELRRVTAAAVAAAAPAPAVRVDLDLDVNHTPTWSSSDEGAVSEIAFCAGSPDHVWAGDTSGVLYKSADGGATWRIVAAPELADRLRPIEAIVIHPEKPEHLIVGLKGRTLNANDAGFVFRSTNGGNSWSHVGGDMKDANNMVVGANGFEVDPDDPDIVWAATEVGVFRSKNFGGSWEPLNHGLPNAEVVDIVLEPTTRTLKAGLWGRGVWARHVGDRAVADVVLVVRSNLLDDGTRPPLRGADAIAVPPGPAAFGSPDIKVTRLPLPAAGALLDGVTFDERIAHERPGLGASTVCVQVHNRGAFPSRHVRVTAAWAPLVDGRPPRLQAAFFTDRAAGALNVDTDHGGWRVIGDAEIPSGPGLQHDVVTPDHPRVMRFPYNWAANAVNARRIAIVAVVTGDEDASLPAEGAVEDLVISHAKIAVRVTDTLSAPEDQTIVLRSLTGQPFQLVNPNAPANPAATLGLPLGAAAATRAISNTAANFVLNGAPPEGFRVQLQSQRDVSFAASPDIITLAATTAGEVRRVIDRDLWDAGVPVRGRVVATVAGTVVGLAAQGAAQLNVVAPSTAAAPLGLAVGGALAANVTGAGVFAPFALGPGPALSLQVNVQYDHEITFPAGTPEIANIAAALPHEVRAAINKQLEHTGIPIVAEPARIELVVRRSRTEAVRGGAIGGEHLADVVVANAAVAAADQAALFDLVTVLQADRARRNVVNRLYLRSANLGNIRVAAVRHRLFSIDLAAAAPFAAALIGAAVAADLESEGTAITEFQWNPGAVDAGRRFLILAVADLAPANPLEPPASFATMDALHAFCLANPNAAARSVEISA